MAKGKYKETRKELLETVEKLERGEPANITKENYQTLMNIAQLHGYKKGPLQELKDWK